MKLHPLSLALAEAPVDPFLPDGEQRWKLVVRSRTHGLVAVTGEHPSPEAALAEFAETSLRLNTLSRMSADLSVRVNGLEGARWKRR